MADTFATIKTLRADNERQAAELRFLRAALRQIAGMSCVTCSDVAYGAVRALALEEAARVADSYARTHEYKRQMFDDGEITTHTGRALVNPRAIAAAIRALFQKETPNA